MFLPLTLDQVSLMKRAVLKTDAVNWAPDGEVPRALSRGARAIPRAGDPAVRRHEADEADR
jgi:hypothetical protein